MSFRSRRLAIITMSSYPFHTRGAEIGIYYLSKQLTLYGVRPTLYLSEFVPQGRPVELPPLPAGMRIIQSPGLPLRLLYNATFVMRTLARLATNEDRPDALLVNLPTMLSLSTAYLAKILLRRPYIVIIHGPYDLERKSGIVLQFQCKIISEASEIVCVSRKLVQTVSGLCSLSSRRIYVIPNGYDPEEIRSASSLTDKTRDVPNLAFVGALIEEKDPLTLIRSLKTVRERKPEVVLHIVGQGPLEGAAHKLVAEEGLEKSVVFHDFMPHGQLLNLLAGCSLLAVPSRREGMPTVIIEALALGLPVVATNTDGLAEIVSSDSNGYLVPVGDEEELAKQILRIIEEPRLRVRLSEGAKASSTEYTWDHIAQRYASLLFSVLGSKTES